jgi:flagellar motor switch protein FliG
MEGLVKVTNKRPLKGYEKAAVLLGELGPETSKPVLDALKLTRKESRRIRKNIKKLGRYNPNNFNEVNRELSVLTDTINYGKAKGIFNSARAIENSFIKKTETSLKQMANSDPDSIANVLKLWLEK